MLIRDQYRGVSGSTLHTVLEEGVADGRIWLFSSLSSCESLVAVVESALIFIPTCNASARTIFRLGGSSSISSPSWSSSCCCFTDSDSGTRLVKSTSRRKGT